MTITKRLRRLERRVARPQSPCADPKANLILSSEADPLSPSLTADVPRCRRCGGQHVLVLEEVIVEPDTEGLKAGENTGAVPPDAAASFSFGRGAGAA